MKRDTTKLDPSEMTKKELEVEKARCLKAYNEFVKLAKSMEDRAVLVDEELSKPRLKSLDGGKEK